MEENKCLYFRGVEEKAEKFRVKCGEQVTIECQGLKAFREFSKKCVGGEQETCKTFLCRELERMDVKLQWSEYDANQLFPIYNQKVIEEANAMEQHTMPGAVGEITLEDRHTKAIELHEGIRADVRVVAQGLSNIGKKLKKMRDEKLYTELGHETFADYGKAMLGLEQRQLYSYIQIYETYGPRFIDEYAELGISKLLLLTNVPATEREEFIEENGVESLTVRQLKEMTEKYNRAAEQLSLLVAQSESVEAVADSENHEKQALLAQIEKKEAAVDELSKKLEAERLRYKESESNMLKQLQEISNCQVEVSVQKPDEKVLKKIRQEESEKAKKDAAVEIKEAKDKAKVAADKKIKEAEDKAKAQIDQAKKEAIERAASEIKNGLTSIQREKAEALARAADLEKKLSLAANNEIIKLNTLFEQMQELVEKVRSCILEVEAEDLDKAKKLKGAAISIINSLKERVER